MSERDDSTVKTRRSLSDRLREHLPRNGQQSDEEREKIRALADEIGQRSFSTIARVMAEGGSRGAGQSRGSAAIHRILERIEEQPGCDVHDLSRHLGEKNIVVLSHVDDLIREGLLVRLEDGRLYRSRDLCTPEEETLVHDAQLSESEALKAVHQREQAWLFIRVFRYLSEHLDCEPQTEDKMTLNVAKGKFFEMKGIRAGVNISLYGIYPGDLVDRFRRTVDFKKARVTFSRLTGILDIRGCDREDIEKVLPWIVKFHQHLKQSV